MSALIGLGTLACLFGAYLLVRVLHLRLPESHRSDDSRDALRLGVGVVATLSGLVLGLVLSTVKTNFDGVQRDVRRFSIELSSLDLALRGYGAGGDPARAVVLDYARLALRGTWQHDDPPTPLDDPRAALRLQEAERLIIQLAPADRMQTYYATRARATVTDIARLRATLISEDNAYLPPIFLVLMVIWLTILFASFGFRAPANATVTGGMLLTAFVVASAVFLMVELDGAFSGLITVSSEPLRQAIAAMAAP